MESIVYARLPDNIVVIRVSGRGNHINAVTLRALLDQLAPAAASPYFVFDLEKCTAMDSTFLGVMASFALRQRKANKTKTIVTNLTDHVRESLELLGLKFVLDMRGGRGASSPTGSDAKFAPATPPEMTKPERIALMIEAHERLIDIDSQNEVKFRGVLQDLRESLDRTRETP